ncbi:DUF397 domain-containing protein [Micromonospora saelicesensis]|uniref:DUF397 domain-containing protein n=1 Tax=Micromonospora saelicesensis TaxID=285676 RepID=A0A1C4WFP1_9ACTN|nr:DUF397 domain-containing protein [Micromonospora saelicesensis]SCE94741.1 protein of unknown function (DUF397) [Micromonospora saelicesensis]
MTDLTGAIWRKSTRSGDNGGNCVEVATNIPGIVAVRDSKNIGGAALRFDRCAWLLFTAAVKSAARPGT